MRKLIRLFSVLVGLGLLAFGSSSCSPQAKKAGRLQQADRYFESGQYDKAEIEYMNVLQIEPLNPQAIGRLGSIYFDQGRLGRVMPYLIKGEELQPDNLDIRLKVGVMSLSIGNLKRAREEAVFILDRKPQDEDAPLLLVEASGKPEEIEAARLRLLQLPPLAAEGAPVLLALGTLELRQRHIKQAETAFLRAQTQDPMSSSVQAALGGLYRAQNNLPAAEQAFKKASDLAPARSPKRLLYAKFKIQSGDMDTGRHALEEIGRKTPDFLQVWILLAEIAAAQERYAESTVQLSKVLALDPAHPEALLLSGRLRLAQGEKEKAVAEMEKMLKVYPQSPQVHYQLGLAYYASGDFGKAAVSLNRAVALAPGYPEAIVLLAELNLRKGDFRMAIASLKPLVQQRPENAQARFLLAEAYRNQGDLNEALAVYRQAEESFPRNPQAPYWKGMILLQQNKREEARQAFGRALELAPNYLLAVEQLLNLDLVEKAYAKALQRAEAQIAKDPKQPGPYLLQAKVFLAQTEVAKAESALRKAIELQPDAATPYLLLARLYASSNQLEKALANFQAVVARNPRNVEARMLIGTIQNQQKNYNGAREAYEKLLAVNPNFSAALNNLAYLYSEKFNQLDKAQTMALKAKELLPHEPHTADTLGWILYKKRQYPWALSLFLDSAGKLPDSAEVLFHLGMTHYMMGEEKAARDALARALQLEKDFPGKDEAQQCLSILAINAETAGPSELASLEKKAAERPDDPVVLTRLAAIYAHGEMVDQAVKAYQAALRASPNNVAAMTKLSRLYAAHGENAKALELAKNARKLEPDDPEAAHTLGRLAYQTGDYVWAVSLLQETARKTPEDPEVLFDLAEASFGIGRTSDAEAAMRRALQADPLFSRADMARLFLEMTELAANPSQAAQANVAHILLSKPNYVPALIAQAALSEQHSDAIAATQTYEKVLGIFPDFVPAKRHLAIYYAENPGDNKRAYDLAVKARESFPDDPQLTKALGLIVYRMGDFNRAAVLLREGANKLNRDAGLLYYLGMAQYKLKRWSESRQSLQRALDLNLRADLALEARRLLTETK